MLHVTDFLLGINETDRKYDNRNAGTHEKCKCRIDVAMGSASASDYLAKSAMQE